MNDLCRGLTTNGIVELVLNHSVEIARNFGILIVVNQTFSKYVGNLLPDATLARTDRLHALQELTEVVFAERRPVLLHPLVVQREALDDVFAQDLRRPNSELRRPPRIHPITDGNDCVQIVEINRVFLRFTFNSTVPSGCFHFGNNHSFNQFTTFKDILQMLTDCRLLYTKQLSHRALRQPQRLILQDSVVLF